MCACVLVGGGLQRKLPLFLGKIVYYQLFLVYTRASPMTLGRPATRASTEEMSVSIRAKSDCRSAKSDCT